MEQAIWALIGVVLFGIWVVWDKLESLYTAQKYTNTLLIALAEKLPTPRQSDPSD